MQKRYKTILLEDDMMARMLLEIYCLNHPNIELVADFDDVPPAIDYVKSHPVDLVFLDISLKNSSGFDLLPAFTSGTYVVITTADTEISPKAKTYGLDHALIKPFTLQEFLSCIEDLKNEWNQSPPAS